MIDKVENLFLQLKGAKQIKLNRVTFDLGMEQMDIEWNSLKVYGGVLDKWTKEKGISVEKLDTFYTKQSTIFKQQT